MSDMVLPEVRRLPPILTAKFPAIRKKWNLAARMRI